MTARHQYYYKLGQDFAKDAQESLTQGKSFGDKLPDGCLIVEPEEAVRIEAAGNELVAEHPEEQGYAEQRDFWAGYRSCWD